MGLTFLNAGFLFAALAALLPVLIHLISRRRVETVDFSSLRFLKELQRKRIRRVRLRQILLLIVRSLILLCAGLALARPTLRGRVAGSHRAHARTSVAIVLDSSASMSRSTPGGDLFEQARGVAREIAGLLAEGDQAFLVEATDPKRSVLREGTFSRDVLVQAVDELESGFRATDYPGAIATAWELLAGSHNLNREMYIIGDLQRSGWVEPGRLTGLSEIHSPDRRGGGVGDGGGGTRLYFIHTPGPVGNVGVSSLTVSRKYGTRAGSYAVEAELTNWGAREREILVKLFIDGTQVGQAGADLPPAQTATARFVTPIDESRWHSGWVELPPDAFEADNRRYFVLPPKSEAEVLVVGRNREAGQDDSYFVERALDPTGSGAFAPVVIDVGSLSRQELGRFPVVIIADVGRVDRDSEQWLERHVALGGGLLLVLGNQTDVRFFNSGSLPRLVGGTIRAPFERSGAAEVRLVPAVASHPLLAGLVVGDRLIDDVRVRRGFRMDLTGVEEVLEFPGIGPALAFTRPGGGGEVAALFTGLDVDWSGLPKSGLFVPLLHRLAGRLARSGRSVSQVLIGEDVVVPLDPAASVGEIESTLPDGSSSLAEVEGGSPPFLAVSGVALPGVYRFASAGREIALAAANLDARESDLSAASPAKIDGFLSPVEHRFISGGRALEEQILEARLGRELWRVLIYVSLGLVGVEMALARPRVG